MRPPLFLVLPLRFLLPLLAATACLADDPYAAVWSDGSVTTSATPLEWLAQERNPSLGKQSPLWGANPLRRLRTTELARPTVGGGRIELRDGDRLTGHIVEYLPAEPAGVRRPACLVVDPLSAPDQPAPDVPVRIRIPVERIRRVVWEERTPRLFRPNTLYYRDGRQTTFRSLRWEAGQVRLLVEQGVETVAWDDLAEVQLAEPDAWTEHAEQTLVLMPEAAGRAVRFETTSGARLTTSLERLRATGDVAKPESQIFVLQPAWSLDALTIPLRYVTSQTIFAPEEAALSDFEPSAYAHRAALGGGWKQWRADVNVQGDLLIADGREYGWGFGVHGQAELQFDLPPWVRAFRTRLALDRAAGDGGCVKAKIYFGANQAAGSVQGRPLYESPPIVGSAAPFDSGRLELRPASGRANRLVLVCDALPYDRPADSDPLDVRDVFDWLEPIVEFDAALFKQAIARQAAAWPAKQHGCTIVGAYGEAWRLVNHGYEKEWRLVVEGRQPTTTIVRTLRVPAEKEALALRAGSASDRNGVTSVKLVVGTRELGKQTLPFCADPRNPPTLSFAVPANLRGRDVRYDFIFETTQEAPRYDVFGVEVR